MPDEQLQQNNQDNQSEYLKFVAVLALLLAIIFCIAAVAPPFFSNAVPAALGLEETTAETSGTIPQPGNLRNGLQTESEPAGSGLEGQTTPAPITVHTVKEGESLKQIAINYNVSLESLAAANNIINPQQIAAGTVLVIPEPQ